MGIELFSVPDGGGLAHGEAADRRLRIFAGAL